MSAPNNLKNPTIDCGCMAACASPVYVTCVCASRVCITCVDDKMSMDSSLLLKAATGLHTDCFYTPAVWRCGRRADDVEGVVMTTATGQ